MGHAKEELNTGSKEWAEDLVDDFDDMDARANVLQHMNQLVRLKGGLLKFLQCLVRSLEVHGVDASASVADATAAVCAEDVCVCQGLLRALGEDTLHASHSEGGAAYC